MNYIHTAYIIVIYEKNGSKIHFPRTNIIMWETLLYCEPFIYKNPSLKTLSLKILHASSQLPMSYRINNLELASFITSIHQTENF